MATLNRKFLLDCSGSMAVCRDDVIGGFNTLVKDQVPFGGTLSLTQFDHEIIKTFENVPIEKVPLLSRETYTPRGSTALLDAIGAAIKETNEPCTLIIQTDGYENASTKFTKAHVKDLIEQKQKEGWVFIYLGANQDAFAEAGALGIAAANTINYDVNRTPEAFNTLSQMVSSQASNNIV
jgi:hypothetical protein